jgi:hypothetical protein
MSGSSTTRFRKGQSGNPAGRPRERVASPSSFDVILDRTLNVLQGGVARELTVEEALQHRIYEQALAGKANARRKLLRMIEVREKARTAKAPPPSPVRQLVEPSDPDNAFEALQILSIACPDPSWTGSDKQTRLLLEPWAVQMALDRHRRRELSDRTIAEIMRCTHRREMLRWPRTPRK